MMVKELETEIIKGGSFTDTRGSLKFVNDFDFSRIKRFYQIVHHDASVVRAWQGHKIEHKYFYVAVGSFFLAWVKVDNWTNPSSSLKVNNTILSSDSPAILSIPPGYANGIKAQTPDSILMVYSNLTLKESEDDRWSFDSLLWLNWNKI